ncbi:MAG: hypothetical protein AB7P99_04825 [Vicinamibacterales bacterium]
MTGDPEVDALLTPMPDELRRQLEALGTDTPTWVRRCRAMGHKVVLRMDEAGVSWQCTACGKDRP